MMLWVKAFHIIAIVAWFAGLCYLPRLFVYHTGLSLTDKEGDARFCTMERRLFWGIMTPSGLLALLLGVALIPMMQFSFAHPPFWLKMKLLLVGMLILYHGYCGILVERFKQTKNTHSERFYRIFNEIPILILIVIVLMVVIKPG